MLRNIFTITSIIVVALLVIDIIYNLKYVNSSDRNALSLLTIQNVSGNWMWPALAASYVISEFSVPRRVVHPLTFSRLCGHVL